MATLQDKKRGGGKQLSETAIRERIRPHVPSLIEKALYIAEHGDSDSNKLGAIKLLLAKVAPDLKAQELVDHEGNRVNIIPLLGGVVNAIQKNDSNGEDTQSNQKD